MRKPRPDNLRKNQNRAKRTRGAILGAPEFLIRLAGKQRLNPAWVDGWPKHRHD